MASWDTETDCYNDLMWAWGVVDDYTDTLIADRVDVWAYFDHIDDEYVKGALGKVCNAIFHTSRALVHILNKNTDYTPKYNPIYYIKNYAGGEAEAITWKDIIKAWVSMNKAEMLYTVDFVDQMRQTVWNEPITLKMEANPFE